MSMEEANVVIVSGVFELDPDQREEFLIGRGDLMRNTRTEAGCLEYTFSADPVVPGRVLLFERWASQEDLDTHLTAARAQPPSLGPAIPMKSASITLYDVTGERALVR